ncbi:hypothetical protein H7347_00935 [Corynebacterium sp. zg-331]|uniref:hypothetical protein n=1 Tax=unclassified Corynebacterium TaxID=2624378 RepID=UPI00128B9BB3|nr:MULTISPECIES: hypothetical protein [unclassified Corynebacterium]MBC3185151.1 hypothetical protein [Corynebacterium sp. zg-331]MPV51649.1 hypothetical protein [Corynebacterium sp. zg331]
MNLKRKFALSAATVAVAATAAIAPATAETVVGQDRPAFDQQNIVTTDVKPASDADSQKQRLESAEKGVDLFAKVVKTIADTVARFVG